MNKKNYPIGLLLLLVAVSSQTVHAGVFELSLTADGESRWYDYFSDAFGQVDQGSGIVAFDTSKPPLDDVRVRKALAYAVDRKVEVQAALGGVGGILATDWFGPKSKWYCGGKTNYPEYDPRKARELLKYYGKHETVK